jgi:tetratricopeptide (TPR) repeat protein
MAFACLLACVIPSASAADNSLREAETLLLAQRTRPDSAQFERAKTIAAAEVKRVPGAARGWKLLAWSHMLEHRFLAALDAAKTADRLAPDDPITLALLDDALVELGRYDEAVAVAQRLADLAPGVPASIRVARLRFLYNDLDGAIQLLSAAAKGGRGESGAWVWLELARLHLLASDSAAARQAIAAAREAYPRLPAILPTQARLLLAEGDARAALDLYRQALVAQPAAEVALAAWRLAHELGEAGHAKHYAALLEGLAKLDTQGLSRRALADYFAETGRTQSALKLAGEEFAARPDLYSHATLARVLQHAGDALQAQRHAQAALALDTPDPQLQTEMRAILVPSAAAQTARP